MGKETKTYLFVCMANMNRSPTAADVFKGLAKIKSQPVITKSAGISHFAEQPINEKLVQEADLIFVMEEYMKQHIETYFQVESGRIISLGIPDIYEKNDPALIKILRDLLEPYIRKETG
jgi:predicted protein tyrosine phosphatase